MRRLVVVSATVLAVAATARVLSRRRRDHVPAEGNGHSADADRTAALKARIAAARRRLQDELGNVRGE
jgi:hypothetical protein